MMDREVLGGEVLGRGTIRVDARRAVAKLREHRLVDLHAYILDLARAAVLAGATGIQIHHDADELYLQFDGAACRRDELEHLLDHALSSTDDALGHRLRLLALGVNSALALRPSFVDVYSFVPGGDCIRARFQSERFEDLEQDTPLVFHVDESTPPDNRPVVGTCIHIRRSWGWAVFYRALTLKSPPEVAVLAEATHHFPLPIEHAGRAIRREPRARVLAILTLQGPWRLRIEMTERTGVPPQIEFLEQGVQLLSEEWLPGELPFQALLDADFLPTNASRSALREDRRLETARRLLREGLGPCLAGVAQVLDGCESPPGLEVFTRDLDALGASFGVAAGAVLEAMRAGRQLGAAAKAFVDLPILRDGVGRRLRPRALLEAARNDGYVLFLRASEPLPLDHGLWMERVVWFNGPYVEAMLSALPLRDVESLKWLRGRCLTACDGRPVLIAGDGTNPFLGAALEQALLKSVLYERGLELAQAYDATQTRKVLQNSISTCLRDMGQSVQLLVFFAQEQGAGFIAPSAQGKVLRFHLGRAVAETSHSLGLGTTTVAIEEWSLVPTAAFGGVEWPKYLELRGPEAALCDIVIAVLEGQTEWAPSQVCFVPNLELVAQHSSLRSYLLGIAHELRAHVASGHQIDAEIPASLSRIVNLKMLNWVDEGEGEAKASIRQITSLHSATVPLAMRGTMPRPPKGTVLFDDECERAALEAWFPRNVAFAVAPKAARQPPAAKRREVEERVDIGALLSHPRSERPWAPPARHTPSVAWGAAFNDGGSPIDRVAAGPEFEHPSVLEAGETVGRLPSLTACSLEDATQGPLLRYDASRKCLRVRRDRLEFAEGSALSQHALRALTAAGMAEFNRELDVVTDAEERRALVKLFQDWARTKSVISDRRVGEA